MPETAEISVVIPTLGRPERLATLLSSLRAQSIGTERFEVIVVDDPSVDDQTAELLRDGRTANGIRLNPIARRPRSGAASARNAGWREATAPLIAFIDDDCEADSRWLERLAGAAGESPGALVQGRTEANPSEAEAIGPFTRTQTVTTLGPYYQTCNIAYPRAVLELLDGFDESFAGVGGEDTDLAWRARGQGVETRFAPEALVHHAVEDLGPAGKLRIALRWSDTMQNLRRHPELRRELHAGIFWKPSHAKLLLALIGIALLPRARWAILLALPYAREVSARMRAEGASPRLAPYYAVHDALETYATVRGAIRHRILVI